jgi:hypothetical protein
MAEADKVIVGKGFTVEIAGHGFLPIKEKRGGKPEGEQADVTHGLSKHAEATAGHSTISELELVAFVTPNQKHFADIAKKVAIAGEQYRVNITVTELAKNKTPVKTFNYFDCLITSYDYAKFEAGSGELMTETATFKPTRLEVS